MPFKGGHSERIGARFEKLDEFDVRKALEEQKLRHEDWKTLEPKPTPPAGVWLWSEPRNEPALTERTLVAAYNLAG